MPIEIDDPFGMNQGWCDSADVGSDSFYESLAGEGTSIMGTHNACIPDAGISDVKGHKANKGFKRYTISELVETFPKPKPPLIHGLSRIGETVGIHAKSKSGKTWLEYAIALNVATGYHLFGQFKCEKGRVLILDYELHPETLAGRIPTVAKKMNLDDTDYRDNIEVEPLRGRNIDIHKLSVLFDSINRDEFQLIILDALYRSLPAGTSENDNAQMAEIFNAIDRYAADLNCCFMFIHHASKGLQGEKDVVDVGSGAGSIARAPDSHLVLRPHQEPNHIVLDAALRSWQPVEPLVLKWEYPLFHVAEDVDPKLLKGTKQAKTSEAQTVKDLEGISLIKKVYEREKTDELTRYELRTETGMGVSRLNRLINTMIDNEEIEKSGEKPTKNGTTDLLRKLFNGSANGSNS